MDFQLNLNSEPVTAAYLAEPLAVEPDTTIREVFGLMRAQRASSVLVCREGVLVGIVTERDALRLLASSDSLDQPIERVMVSQPATIRAEETVGAAIQKMSDGGYRRLPVIDAAGRPLGLLRTSGVVRYLVEHFPRTIYTLPPEPNTIMQDPEGA